MSLVLLTGTGPEHRYVARRIADAFPDQLQAIIIAEPSHPPLARVRTLWRRYSVPQLVSRILARAFRSMTRRDETRARVYEETLFPAGTDSSLPRPDLIRIVPSHNGEDCLRLLGAVNPAVIAVYGTAMIRSRVVAAARTAVLNMHTGLSPRYRGSDTVFWPLHNEEPEWIGVTVHVLDERLDAGPILATARPTIAADDTEDTLFAKCVRVGADHYVQAIGRALHGDVRGHVQELASGREYRFVDRTLSAELRVDRLLRGGLLRRYTERNGA